MSEGLTSGSRFIHPVTRTVAVSENRSSLRGFPEIPMIGISLMRQRYRDAGALGGG
jgi:hypothetical protein